MSLQMNLDSLDVSVQKPSSNWEIEQSDVETRVLEKGLDYAPIQRKINEPELRRNFNDFAVGCALNSFFEKNPIQLMKNLHLDLSQHGSLSTAILVWKFFKSGKGGIV